MTRSQGETPSEARIRVFNGYRELFAAAPIRLMSRTVSDMRSLGYPDLATAIGDLDWRTVPADDPEDPELRQDWQAMIEAAFGHVDRFLERLDSKPMGYNLDSVGYPTVTAAWGELWARQLGIAFANRPLEPPQVMLFHGGNQAIQAALLGVAEARRDRVGSAGPPTVLVPIPSFSCPLDQFALQGVRVVLLPPADPGMDPSVDDLARVPGSFDIDGVYLMPINNPTGRTLSPERLRRYLEAVLERWPHAGLILDAVYVRLHPAHRELVAWFDDDPRFSDAVLFIDSLSKTHGATGLRAGAVLTRSDRLGRGALRYAQNVMAGPSNVMQAVALALLEPFARGDEEGAHHRIQLQIRIGRHLQRRRRLLLETVFDRHRELLDQVQPLLPDPVRYDWQGSMYAGLRLSDRVLRSARTQGVSPAVAFYLETGVGGVPLDQFCRNSNLDRHRLVANADDPVLRELQEHATRYVRLAFGMTPPPDPSAMTRESETDIATAR